MLTMAMAIVVHSPLLPAQTHSDSISAMSWPVQQGESLNDIARLFYPKNKYMQQQFIAAVIRLNQETKPDFNASKAFTDGGVIVIPSIKVLSKKSRHEPAQLLGQSRESQVVEHSLINTKLIENYENLVHRNTVFKRELEYLNDKLAHLKQVLDQLTVDLTNIFAAYDNTVAVNAAKLSETQSANTYLIKPEPAIVKSADKPIKLGNAEVVPSSPLWKSILTALLFSTLFVSAIWYSFWLLRKLGVVYKQKVIKHKSTEDDVFKPLDINSFNDNLVLPHQSQQTPPHAPAQALVELNKFSDSILQLGAAVMPVATKELNEKEEGELMLAQASIYVNLERYDNAIRLLSAYIKVAPKAAWQHWLCLLDVYRKANQKEEFMEVAKQLHQIFNVETPEWETETQLDDNTPANTVKHSLEDYDVIMDKVTKLWAECKKEANKIAQTKSYLDELILDNRDSERSGFNMEVFEEIMLLRNMLDAREKLAKEF
jgi:tetratricopeptide (TPR) repeat protein